MYMIAGADNIQAVFRNSKDLSFEFMQLRVAQAVKGLPAQDAAKLALDDSGTGAVPFTALHDDSRIWRKLHDIYLNDLTEGKAVNFLTGKFISEFSAQLEPIAQNQWATLPIYAFLQDKMFQASTITLAGPHLNANPNFTKNFWNYDAAFMTLLQGAPRFLCRKGWQARDDCLQATKNWLQDAWENVDWRAISQEKPDWEENFGHRLMRSREETLARYGISLEGRASLQMGLIWAINANAIPMTAYILIELIRNPSLLQRIRAEVGPTVRYGAPTPSTPAFDIDIRALCALPLLNSVYKECLRLRASIPLTRRLRNDIEIDGYILRKGNFILAPSWLSHMDEAVWGMEQHPADEFWAERFLQKEAAPGKGGIRSGDFFPYGGGSVICPGRFFAKQEIFAAVAMLVMAFDFEFVKNVHLDGRPSKRGPDVENCESRGIISLDRDVVVRMCKREMGYF